MGKPTLWRLLLFLGAGMSVGSSSEGLSSEKFKQLTGAGSAQPVRSFDYDTCCGVGVRFCVMMLESDLKLPTNVIEFQAAKPKQFFAQLHAAKKRIQSIRNSIMPQALAENHPIEHCVVGYENFRPQLVSELIPQIRERRSIANIFPLETVNTGEDKPTS